MKIQSAIFENTEQILNIAWQMEQNFEQLFNKSAVAVALNMMGCFIS